MATDVPEMVARVRRASHTYYPNGGDDWGYVTNRRDGVNGEDVGSYNKAAELAEVLNARAAIEAMREPTDEMVMAAMSEADRQGVAFDEMSPPMWFGKIHASMIDAALGKEQDQ